MEKIAAPSMKPTTFAPTIVGSRKIESGSSGLLARCSLMTNRIISTAETAKKPSVRAENQWYWSVLTTV